MKSHKAALLLALASIASINLSFAQSTPEELVSAAPETKPSELLLIELQQNEIALYAIYNGINDSDENDIACVRETTAESLSGRLKCEPAFLVKMRQEVTQEIEQDSSTEAGLFTRIRNSLIRSEARVDRELRRRSSDSLELLQEEFESLASSHPPLREKLETIGALQLAYADSVRSENSRRTSFMRMNDPSYSPVWLGGSYDGGGNRAGVSRTPWYKAPARGY